MSIDGLVSWEVRVEAGMVAMGRGEVTARSRGLGTEAHAVARRADPVGNRFCVVDINRQRDRGSAST
jgi:hypothetical protein